MLYKKYVSMMVVMALLLCLTMPAKVNAESRQPCGPDAWYELSEDGTLVISGTGEITKDSVKTSASSAQNKEDHNGRRNREDQEKERLPFATQRGSIYHKH
ncbi:MAG: hypothetical protein ACLSG9_04125 [Eubacterium sp.]